MKRRMLALLLVFAFALCLPACGGGGGSLPDEPYEPVEYTLYPAPEDAYVGDTMPFVTEDGTMELYYLYDTDHNGQGYHPVWRYTTDDFVGYQDDGMVLNYGTAGDADLAIGTGSVMQDQEGLYHLFYTGHNDNGNGGKGKESVMHATSTDRQNWEKHPEDTFFSPDNYSKDDFRDPEVFWVEEEQCYWLLIAAREQSRGGVVAKYTSTDLKNWTFCEEPLFAPMQQYMLECPSIIHLGDKYYLTYSWDCVTYYAVADDINGPYTAPRDNVLDGTGFIFYAAKTKMFKDKPYLCGWLGRAALTVDGGLYQWAGSVLNHQLVQKEDGSLGVKEPDSFHDYFTEDKTFKTVKKEGKVKISKDSVTLTAAEDAYALADMGTRAPTMLLECDVKLDENGCAGFAFGGTEDDPSYTALCLNAKQGLIHYEGTEVQELDKYDPVALTHFDFSASEAHHVKLVCENEVVVVYVDDTKALSNRIFHSTDGAHIGLFSSEGEAVFSNVTMKTPVQ